jgi:hypothetical protein
MGYLICDKCGGYYKLDKGESADDFDDCQCGGKLRYVDSLDEYLNDEQYKTKYSNIEESTLNLDKTDENQRISEEEPIAADVIYKETIYLSWLVVIFILTLVGTFIVQSLVVPNEAKPLFNIVFLTVIIAALFSANFLILRIKITQEYLSVSCGIFKHITAWDDIIDCHVDIPPTVRFNGYGIRYGRINGKRVQGYVMGNPKVIISLNRGKYNDFIFTTKNPQEVCKLIKEQIG